jgi:hypothetical protein
MASSLHAGGGAINRAEGKHSLDRRGQRSVRGVELRPRSELFIGRSFASKKTTSHRRQARRRWLPAVSAPATSAATAAVTTVSAATSATLHFRPGLVDVEGASAELSAVEGGNRLFSVFRVRHLHKTEPARAAGVPVGHDADSVYLSVCLEHLAQFFFRRVEVEVSNENVLQANASE